MRINQKFVNTVGSLGVIMACLMFGSYLDQIGLNWVGNTGSLWLGPTTVSELLADLRLLDVSRQVRALTTANATL